MKMRFLNKKLSYVGVKHFGILVCKLIGILMLTIRWIKYFELLVLSV